MKFKLFYGNPLDMTLEDEINNFLQDKRVHSFRTNIHKDDRNVDELIVSMLYE